MELLNPAGARTAQRTPTAHNAEAVVTCYSVLDRFFPACGFRDFTEGVYHHNSNLPFDEAQTHQLDYLLDEAKCVSGSKLLDIGCGYGHLLERVRERGAEGVGITISPEQTAYCRERRLDVHLLNYRMIDNKWDSQFDCVVANGSMEHFAQPRDAAAGQDDTIYHDFFQTVHRLLNPCSPARRFVSAAIHFAQRPDPHALLRSPLACGWRTDAFHFGLLARSFGGWYPAIGQLERCASDYFELLCTDDGTKDLFLTSEEWLGRVRRTLMARQGRQVLRDSLPVFGRHPIQFTTMLLCMLGTESWNWQFRGPNPPTRLLRQTWGFR